MGLALLELLEQLPNRHDVGADHRDRRGRSPQDPDLPVDLQPRRRSGLEAPSLALDGKGRHVRGSTGAQGLGRRPVEQDAGHREVSQGAHADPVLPGELVPDPVQPRDPVLQLHDRVLVTDCRLGDLQLSQRAAQSSELGKAP